MWRSRLFPVRSGISIDVRLLVVACFMLLAAETAVAADESPVLYESPRAKLTLGDYEAEMAKLTPSARLQFAANRGRLQQMLDHLFLNRALANDARAMALDRDPVVAAQIALQIDKLLAQVRIDRLDRDTTAAFDANPEKYAARAREIYLSQPDRFRAPERVRVSHVLIKIGADGDAAAKSKAEAVRARALAGADFAELARDASDDASGKKSGGDLGLVTAKGLDPAFAAAAFALKEPGELSPVVKTKSGYHVIRLAERVPATTRTFDEAKPEIMAEIRKGLIDVARTEYQSKMFADPVPTINQALIEKINRDAAETAPPIDSKSIIKR